LYKIALARLVAGALASGAKAASSVAKCFSEENRKRTVAFAFINSSLIDEETCFNKQVHGAKMNKREKRKKAVYSFSFSATVLAVSSTGAPLAARFAMIPSFVTGV
jgi:hypothetical protein